MHKMIKKLVYIRKNKKLNEEHHLSDPKNISKLTNYLYETLLNKVRYTLQIAKSFPNFKIPIIPVNYNYCSGWLGCDTEISFHYLKDVTVSNAYIIKTDAFIDNNNILHNTRIVIFYNYNNLLSKEVKQFIQHELSHLYRHRIQLIRDEQKSTNMKNMSLEDLKNLKQTNEIGNTYQEAYAKITNNLNSKDKNIRLLAFIIYSHIPEELNANRSNFYRNITDDIYTNGKKKKINDYIIYQLYDTDSHTIYRLKDIFEEDEKRVLKDKEQYLFDMFKDAFSILFSVQKVTKSKMIQKLADLNKKQIEKLENIYKLTGTANELKEHYDSLRTYSI